MLNDDKVTSVRFLKGKVLATRISQEKKFEPYFRVPIKYSINLQDYSVQMLKCKQELIKKKKKKKKKKNQTLVDKIGILI